MNGLARRVVGLLPLDEAASAPAWRGHTPLPEVLARLGVAVEHRLDGRVDALLDELLADPYLGRRIVGRVIAHAVEAIAG